ncbi:hypothetical protein NKI06_29845, partial [Mesorhizobium sp. M0772]
GPGLWLVSADVTRNSTISVDRITYSVPSRLIGYRLHAHVYDDRVEFFLGPDRVMTADRVRVKHAQRGRKPQALRYLVYRNALRSMPLSTPGRPAATWSPSSISPPRQLRRCSGPAYRGCAR